MSTALIHCPLHSGQLGHFYQEWKDGTLVLNPEFQRSNMVWDQIRKSRLIESVIIGFPVPPVFLTEAADHKREVVDGLQRLTAIFGFMDGDFALKGMEWLEKAEGMKFDALGEGVRTRITRGSLGFYTLPADNPKWKGKLKHIMFNRLNAGVAVNGIERIMGSLPGEGTTLVNATAQDFLALWPKKQKGLVRRSKHLLYGLSGLIAVQATLGADCVKVGAIDFRRGGRNPWETLMAQALQALNQASAQDRDDLQEAAKEALLTTAAVFDRPFVTWREDGRYNSGVKDAAIVVQMWGFARPSQKDQAHWIANKAKVEDAWKELCLTQKINHQANTMFATLKAWGDTLDKI